MHNHFDQFLNVRELILTHKPTLFVECGGGGGENTHQLMALRKEHPFRIVVINDSPYPDMVDIANERVQWIVGVSYIELAKMDAGVIDFCSIDTDHNYWTMDRELTALSRALRVGGIVVMHDTETYGVNSGNGFSYGTTGVYYPLYEIVEAAKGGKSLRAAIQKHVDAGTFKVIRESMESHGAMALERVR